MISEIAVARASLFEAFLRHLLLSYKQVHSNEGICGYCSKPALLALAAAGISELAQSSQVSKVSLHGTTRKTKL